MTSVRFVASAHAGLEAGVYTVRVGQRLQADGLDAQFGHLVANSAQLTFDAAGPRTELAAGAVVARYPVPASRADQAGTLAHVLLADPTLPWRRRPWHPAGGDPAAPWLALILLTGPEIDMAGRRTVKVSDLGRATEEGERPDALVQLLSLPATLAADVIPHLLDLPFLAHVREVDGPEPSSHAVIVCNRVAPPGRNQVHLVSLEGLATPDGTSPVQLVTLDHWEFESTEDGPGFRDLALAVAHNCGPLRQDTGSAAAREHLRRGVIAVRDGASLSWYRGPLCPVVNDPARENLSTIGTPPVRADELLLWDENLKMADATYAVAWDLGRALILNDGHVALTLAEWWRAKRHQARSHGQLQGLVGHRNPDPSQPAEVQAWFQSLHELRPVPARYLLADPERLVPLTEARWQVDGVERHASGRIAFFAVDGHWTVSMAYGAASVGRASDAERQSLVNQSEIGPMRGFILRSELVRWDDLRIRILDRDNPLDTIERSLGADLRLVLVKTRLRHLTVELSRAPHGLHFGFEETGASLGKIPRDRPGSPPLGAPLRPSIGTRPGTIAAAILASLLGANDSAAFAYQMVVGSPSLRIDLDLEG